MGELRGVGPPLGSELVCLYKCKYCGMREGDRAEGEGTGAGLRLDVRCMGSGVEGMEGLGRPLGRGRGATRPLSNSKK